ncbi:MAG: glycosyl hydrolase 115 family protein [Prevotella sp.]|nr:glycosyl hydrolase 115 family protein [Prevotella sp.]
MNILRQKVILGIFLQVLCLSVAADTIEWYDGCAPVTYNIKKGADPVVYTAADMFCSDIEAVTGMRAGLAEKNATINIIEADRVSDAVLNNLKRQGVPIDSLMVLTDGFHISIIDHHITVVGANGRGTAYGILELSRMAGVSPWIWWGDVVPERRARLTIDSNYRTLQGASVEYRGVFLNDEDWTLRPWSSGTYEPSEFGQIGARTYKKVFQLLLRLRANAIWPGMHTGTKAFFFTKGAKAVADSCGIAIGTSHCEPLLRNNVGEWNEKERGRYNYITNRKAVQDYWIERLKEVKGSAGGNMFTIGMRGIHDGSMEGVKTMDEKQTALQQVIDDQQKLLRKHIGAPEKQMQVFVPYKEVLDIYERGLRVPDYVTLMWCDDNYGYMTRLSDSCEQQRKGGGGVYYHLSYWGRPHDYLWLTTTQPGLVYNEMREAYDHHVRKVWIVNVHDPKVAGYDLELFLDMAWNINCVSASTITDHYRAWLCRQFGTEAGNRLFPAMYEFYRLCGERRPEFMGWSQVELDKKIYARGLSPIVNSEFSTTAFGGELDRYLDRYAEVSRIVRETEAFIRPELRDAYFAAIQYPVFAADAHARKILEAQRAREYAADTMVGVSNSAAIRNATARSINAYKEIVHLTKLYNTTMTGGKWNRSMSMAPRDLPVYAMPPLPVQLSDAEVGEEFVRDVRKPRRQHQLDAEDAIVRNACDYTQASVGAITVQMLGHSMNAVALPKGGMLTYEFTAEHDGKAVLRTAMIPTQPNDGGDLRYSVSIDGGEPLMYTLKEKFRSEGWKRNVLRGQAVREMPVELAKGSHTLIIRALDSHIVADQWMIDYNPQRKYYLFPIE